GPVCREDTTDHTTGPRFRGSRSDRSGTAPSSQRQESRRGVNTSMWNNLKSYFQVLVAELAKAEDGQALVEYALILALVSVVAIGALTLLGGNIVTILNNVAGS